MADDACASLASANPGNAAGGHFEQALTGERLPRLTSYYENLKCLEYPEVRFAPVQLYQEELRWQTDFGDGANTV